MLFSHPSDFTPVCTSELGAAAKLQDEFKKRGVQLIGLSCNELEVGAEGRAERVAAAQHAVTLPDAA